MAWLARAYLPKLLKPSVLKNPCSPPSEDHSRDAPQCPCATLMAARGDGCAPLCNCPLQTLKDSICAKHLARALQFSCLCSLATYSPFLAAEDRQQNYLGGVPP